MISALRELQNKEKILYALLLLFFISLFFGKLSGINGAVTGLIVVYSFTMGTLREKWETLKQRPYVQGMLAFFGLLVLSTFISEDIMTGFHHLKIRLPLLLFPASLGLLRISRALKEKALISFAWITTLVTLLSLVTSIHASGFFQRPEFLYNDSLTAFIRHQSIYIALAVNLAIYIFAERIFFSQSKNKGSMVLAVMFLFAISYLLASRIMFAVLVAATLLFCVYYILKKRKYLEGFTLLLGLVMGTVIIYKLMPSTFQRYQELAYSSYNYESMGKESHYNMEITPDQWNGANFRLAAWACGWELVQAHPITGVDLGDKDQALIEKYQEKNFQFAIKTDKNVHNNYLDILFSMGVFGLLVFLAGWLLLPLRYAAQHRNGLAIVVILTFAIAWITEVYFGRNLGTMLVGFFFPFFLLVGGRKETPQQDFAGV